jgi:hypothetical protein
MERYVVMDWIGYDSGGDQDSCFFKDYTVHPLFLAVVLLHLGFVLIFRRLYSCLAVCSPLLRRRRLGIQQRKPFQIRGKERIAWLRGQAGQLQSPLATAKPGIVHQIWKR